MIDVDTCPGCGMWRCTVYGYATIKSDEEGVARRHARILDQARNRTPREGMRLLCEEIGYSEDSAKELLHLLHGGAPINNGRPN